FEVTDSDGTHATGAFDVDIVDDMPTANADTFAQDAENEPVTVDVLENDKGGADGVDPSKVTLVTGSVAVDGVPVADGRVVYNGDGTFTYKPAPGEQGKVTFRYQIEDADGDTSAATVTIDLKLDSVPQINVNTPTAIVDEDGLGGANQDDERDGEKPSTGKASDQGTITVNYGNDVPADA